MHLLGAAAGGFRDPNRREGRAARPSLKTALSEEPGQRSLYATARTDTFLRRRAGATNCLNLSGECAHLLARPASRGWSVLALNPVGSSSYGSDFSTRLRGHWGQYDLDQQLAAVNALQDEGIADARIAMTGKSYGGFLTAYAIAHEHLLRAAVVAAPVTNLETHYGTSDTGLYSDPYSMCGEPFINRQTSRELSPIQHAEKAHTPTLILQGMDSAVLYRTIYQESGDRRDLSSRKRVWMSQIARHLTDSVDGLLMGKRYLIHDRDPLFTDEFLCTLKTSTLCLILTVLR